tara:strand:+ start:146 stop:466 length:321 start_codon:yes stop_codon:yes gene_type:complete
MNDQQLLREHIQVWIQLVNETIFNQGPRNDPRLSMGNGRKYIKIWDKNGIFAFVRAIDGAILKPKNTNSPMLNHSRGSIYDSDVTKAVTRYGVRYMDDPLLGIGTK